MEIKNFLTDVKELASKYDVNFFIATDGVAMINNNRNEAVENCRQAHIQWELEHGLNPLETDGMIINQDEHDSCFFKIYKSMTVKNLDFLRCRNIDIAEARKKASKMIDNCIKVIFLAQKFEENEIDSNDNDIVDKLIGGRNNERTNH